MRVHLFGAALLANMFMVAAAIAAPELTVEHGTYDFGTVTQGKKVQHNFVIKNSGDSPLQIRGLSASCGCTAAKPSSSTIPPGKKAEIQVTFDSNNFSGKVEKTVTMTSNAGKSPNYTFTMEGTVQEQLQVNPRQVSLGPIAPGGAKQASVTVTNRSANSVKILSVKFNSSSMDVKPTVKKSELKPGESGSIELSVTAHPDAKVLSGYLHIQTSHPQKKELTVPVYASLQK